MRKQAIIAVLVLGLMVTVITGGLAAESDKNTKAADSEKAAACCPEAANCPPITCTSNAACCERPKSRADCCPSAAGTPKCCAGSQKSTCCPPAAGALKCCPDKQKDACCPAGKAKGATDKTDSKTVKPIRRTL